MDSGMIFCLILGLICIYMMCYLGYKDYKKGVLHKQLLQNFAKICEKENTIFELVVDEGGFFLFIDRKTNRFGVDGSGEIYSADFIHSYSELSPFESDHYHVQYQAFSIRMREQEDSFNSSKELIIGDTNKSFISVFSKQYELKRNIINKIYRIFDDLTKNQIEKFYAKSNFSPTDSFFMAGQFIAYDVKSRQIATRSLGMFATIYSFDDYKRAEVLKYIHSTTRPELSGLVVGNSMSAIISNTKVGYCTNMTIEIYDTNDSFVFVQYPIDMSTDYYHQKMVEASRFANFIKYMEKAIDKNPPKDDDL